MPLSTPPSSHSPNPFSLLQSAVTILEAIRAQYRQFPTSESSRRYQILRHMFTHLTHQGYQLTAFFGGSLLVGQSLPSNDLDIIFLAGRNITYQQTKSLLTTYIYRFFDQKIIIDFWQQNWQQHWGQFVDYTYLHQQLDFLNSTGTSDDLSSVCNLYLISSLTSFWLGVDYRPSISRINQLRHQYPHFNKHLATFIQTKLPHLLHFFSQSFPKYRQRLQTNPRFTNLPLSSQHHILNRLTALERKLSKVIFVNFS